MFFYKSLTSAVENTLFKSKLTKNIPKSVFCLDMSRLASYIEHARNQIFHCRYEATPMNRLPYVVVPLLFNPLNPELNPICYLLALLAHHFLHGSRIRVKSLTLRLLMSYIYIYIYIYIWSAYS